MNHNSLVLAIAFISIVMSTAAYFNTPWALAQNTTAPSLSFDYYTSWGLEGEGDGHLVTMGLI